MAPDSCRYAFQHPVLACYLGFGACRCRPATVARHSRRSPALVRPGRASAFGSRRVRSASDAVSRPVKLIPLGFHKSAVALISLFPPSGEQLTSWRYWLGLDDRRWAQGRGFGVQRHQRRDQLPPRRRYCLPDSASLVGAGAGCFRAGPTDRGVPHTCPCRHARPGRGLTDHGRLDHDRPTETSCSTTCAAPRPRGSRASAFPLTTRRPSSVTPTSP
jgi:hypothetical protein